jgi:transketolase
MANMMKNTMKNMMTKVMANREAFGRTLVELGRRNPKVVVLDADVCTSTRTCLFRDAFPERFFQMGVAEQNMVSAAAGMSTVGGLIPWVSTFAVFASKRALDQVSISVAYPRNNVKINGSYSGIPTGKAGATHQAVEDIAIMRAMPNMTVIVPVDGVEVEQAMYAATDYRGPVYLRTTRHETPVILNPETYRFEWGKSVLLREGEDVTLIGTGVKSVLALHAARELEKEGVNARVLHVHTVKPLDREAVIRAAEETRGLVTMENHSVIGGLGGAVAEVLADARPAPLKRIGIPDVFGESGDDDLIFAKMGLSVEGVVRTVRQLLD